MKLKAKSKKQNSTKTFSPNIFFDKYVNCKYIKSLLVNPANLLFSACFLIFAECIINLIILKYVKYTEIDWKAYMQEIEGVLNKTYDYSLLKGDTGPLVYPAGFVWIFTCLYFLTGRGVNISRAQHLFVLFYIINLVLVLRIFIKAKKLPPYVLILTCLTSYRVHSIFVLRLFNDPVAMLLLYASINAFLDSKWNLGSFLFSLAVSVKMNILLFAPAVFLSYLICLGLKDTIKQLIICATLQIILALPFLLTHPVNYVLGAFNFGRVFLHEWTVNWRFLPEYIFSNEKFHIGLLLLHVILLGVFYKTCALHLRSYAKLKAVENDLKKQLKKKSKFNMNTVAQLFLFPMFLSNFIGVVCSRSLHYQFYIWYFHSLPFLLWSTSYSVPLKLCLLGIIELCWNTYPSTNVSSACLHICHLSILYGIYKTQAKLMRQLHGGHKIN